MFEYTQKIRDFINESRRQFNLLKNHKFWNQLCSSIDVIEDCDLAIDAYINSEFGEDYGEKYLKLYGILQALFLQQDAVTNLCESLGFTNNLASHPKLKEIRDIRNDSIGHSTKRGDYKSYHFISRTTITKSGFQIISDYERNKTTSRNVSITELIKIQRKYLSEILKKVISVLCNEEKAHKEKFKMEKLESLFPNTFSYHFNKIYEAIGSPKQAEVGIIDFKQLKKILDELKEAFQKRGIEIATYESIEYLYELLEYPFTELELYFKSLVSGQEPRLNDKTAYIFTFFIEKHLSELKEIVREIDDEYSN